MASSRAETRAALDEILDVFEHLGQDELAVLLVIARRLHAGFRQYGALDVHDGRRWRREAAEEHVDGGVYGACEMLRQADIDALEPREP